MKSILPYFQILNNFLFIEFCVFFYILHSQKSFMKNKHSSKVKEASKVKETDS